MFPKFGHLLLSGVLNGQIKVELAGILFLTVKIWNVYENRQCLRAYLGHQTAVKDICWNSDGSKFLSCAFDRQMRYWDTETGAVLGSYSCGRIPYCVKIFPEGEQTHFIAGCADKKIYQFDLRTRSCVLEYDQHLGPVNALAFVDQNRRFVSSSDDKSLRIWEWGIPVPIKHIKYS